MAEVDPSQRIPLLEKIGYSLGDSAANFVFLTMVIFQQGFYTDVMGLAPSKAALAILVPRLWDAFFDPIIGTTADRTKTRWGRFRPWILWTSVPWCIVMVLAYFTPTGLSDAGMLTWAIVTNTLLMSLYSANNMPYAALGGVMTADLSERNKLNAIRFGAVMVAQWIVQTFTLVLRDKFAGHSQAKADLAHGWTMTMSVYAAICLVCFLICFGTTKERVKPVEEAAAGGGAANAAPKKKHSIGDDLAGLLKNSPWIIMFIVTFVHFTVISFQGGAGYQYFTRYPDPNATYDVLASLHMTDPVLHWGIKDAPSWIPGPDRLYRPGRPRCRGLSRQLGDVQRLVWHYRDDQQVRADHRHHHGPGTCRSLRQKGSLHHGIHFDGHCKPWFLCPEARSGLGDDLHDRSFGPGIWAFDSAALGDLCRRC